MIMIKIIMATIIIIISIFFHHTRKTSFLSAGLGNSGNARIEKFFLVLMSSLTQVVATTFFLFPTISTPLAS